MNNTNNISLDPPSSITVILGEADLSSTLSIRRQTSFLKAAQKNLAVISLAITATTSGLIYAPSSRVLVSTESNDLFRKNQIENEGVRKLELLKLAHFNAQSKAIRTTNAGQVLRAVRPFEGIDDALWNEILEDEDYLS